MKERPRWAFDTKTVLDDIPGAGNSLALWLVGVIGIIIAMIFNSTDLPASAMATKCTAVVSVLTFVYASIALGVSWWRYQLVFIATQSREINPDTNGASAFVDLISERNSFIGQ